MDRALFLAMSGAKQNMQALQLRANNLANVSTTGFRADLAQARSMQAYGDGLPTRVFSMTERPGHNFQQGPRGQFGDRLINWTYFPISWHLPRSSLELPLHWSTALSVKGCFLRDWER